VEGGGGGGPILPHQSVGILFYSEPIHPPGKGGPISLRLLPSLSPLLLSLSSLPPLPFSPLIFLLSFSSFPLFGV